MSALGKFVYIATIFLVFFSHLLCWRVIAPIGVADHFENVSATVSGFSCDADDCGNHDVDGYNRDHVHYATQIFLLAFSLFSLTRTRQTPGCVLLLSSLLTPSSWRRIFRMILAQLKSHPVSLAIA